MNTDVTRSFDAAVTHVLHEGRRTVSDDKLWCSRTVAETIEGHAVCSQHPRAVRWCAVGAALAVQKLMTEFGDLARCDAVKLLNAAAYGRFGLGTADICMHLENMIAIMLYDIAIDAIERKNMVGSYGKTSIILDGEQSDPWLDLGGEC